MTQAYIGTKIVGAWSQEKDGKPGYAVTYDDGYQSWCPKETFERHYRCVSDGERDLVQRYQTTPIAGVHHGVREEASQEGQSIGLTPHLAVVSHTTFRGKDLGLTIYLHPERYQELAPKQEDLAPRFRSILGCFKGLKSGPYRKEALASLKYNGTDEHYLEQNGHIKVNKNGSTRITPKGKNAAGERPHGY